MNTSNILLILLMCLGSYQACSKKSGAMDSFTYQRSGGGNLEFQITRQQDGFKILVSEWSFKRVSKELHIPASDPLALGLLPLFEGKHYFTEGLKPDPGVLGGTWLSVKVDGTEYERAKVMGGGEVAFEKLENFMFETLNSSDP